MLKSNIHYYIIIIFSEMGIFYLQKWAVPLPQQDGLCKNKITEVNYLPK